MKTMDPNRFVIGERVRYVNHVTGHDLGMLEIVRVTDDSVIASRLFDKRKTYKFTTDGRATWSLNLSILKTEGVTVVNQVQVDVIPDDTPEDFKQGMAEIERGELVDLDVALNAMARELEIEGNILRQQIAAIDAEDYAERRDCEQERATGIQRGGLNLP